MIAKQNLELMLTLQVILSLLELINASKSKLQPEEWSNMQEKQAGEHKAQ